MLSFKSCRLEDIGDAPLPASLVWLILTDNRLTALPDSIGRLTRMRKLMLANNRLVALPPSMAAMKELELLRLANNRLPQIPDWLLALPRLTWLAIAGNPCVQTAPTRVGVPSDVKFDELTLGPRLGEGTSSVVRRGVWHDQTVAIKMCAPVPPPTRPSRAPTSRARCPCRYKAPLSSDGRNIDEVRASCAVDHPNVLRWLGYLHEHGDADVEARASSASGSWRLLGIVEWAPGFGSLGKPPSMESVTRDTYDTDARFSGAEIRNIASNIAAAMAHLHSRSVAHGDLYAHNILWKRADEEATGTHARLVFRHRKGAGTDKTAEEGVPTEAAVAKLSDFGAAFYYGGGGAGEGAWYERMEQRAYGLLLFELIERHDGSEPRLLHAVRTAAEMATDEDPLRRPGFETLVQTLNDEHHKPPRRGLRPRGTFGRTLPDDSPLHPRWRGE
jgi:hypothetical protein